MYSLASVTWWSNVMVMALASIIDVRTRRIPNWLVVPFFLSGFAVQAVAGGWAGVGTSLAGAAVACACFVLPCLLGAMGMGDLKLATGAGAWLGPGQFLFAMVMTGIAGGVIALGYAAKNRALGSSFDKTGDLVAGLVRPSRKRQASSSSGLSIPYAPAIAFGVLISFFAL